MTAEQEAIFCHWPAKAGVDDNWGDKFSPVLVNLLSQKAVVNASLAAPDDPAKRYRVVGSGLQSADQHTIVWGSGFLDSESKLPSVKARICAVRGPLSRAKLISSGVPCPPIYGDPALLLPLFYNKPQRIKFDLGIIRHWRELDSDELDPFPFLDIKDVSYINIKGELSTVVDQIRSCKYIASSSLHGIIIAHAYGIPATWIKLSDRPLGDDFKFFDYFSSIGCDDIQPLEIDGSATGEDLTGEFAQSTPIVDIFELIDSCPVVDNIRRRLLRQQAKVLLPEIPPVRFLRRSSPTSQSAETDEHLSRPVSPDLSIPLLSSAEFSMKVIEQRHFEQTFKKHCSEKASPSNESVRSA